MCEWLRMNGVRRLTAFIHAANEPSHRVARRLGFYLTDTIVDVGSRWESQGL